MALRFLEVSNLRIIEHLSLAPHAQTNLFIGTNASGKTSLLEGIHILATGRSFRTRQLDEVRRGNDVTLTVWGNIQHEREDVRAGFEYSQAGRRILIGGTERPSNASLAELLPVLAVFPGALQEFWQHGIERRRLLDWGLFHVEPRFYSLWRRYRRLLKQRNAALQARAPGAVCAAWDADLATLGEQLHEWRRVYIEQLRGQLAAISRPLFDMDSIQMDLKRGWSSELTFSEALAATMSTDQQHGYTHVGPQRDDLAFQWQGRPVRSECSHGQQRLLFIALKLAQLVLLVQLRAKSGMLLIDDLYTELDTAHAERLLLLLGRLPVQSFITTTQYEPLKTLAHGALFHVERGRLRTH